MAWSALLSTSTPPPPRTKKLSLCGLKWEKRVAAPLQLPRVVFQSLHLRHALCFLEKRNPFSSKRGRTFDEPCSDQFSMISKLSEPRCEIGVVFCFRSVQFAVSSFGGIDSRGIRTMNNDQVVFCCL